MAREKNKIVAFNKYGARIFTNPDQTILDHIDEHYDASIANPDISELRRVPLCDWALIDGKIVQGINQLPEQSYNVKIKEIIKEVPVEIIKEIEVIKEVEVIKEIPIVQELKTEIVKTIEVPIYKDRPIEVISERFKILCMAQGVIILVLTLLLLSK